jgi:drug/metabolite transporter (DMT)-like permease
MALFIAVSRVASTSWLDGVAIAVGFAGVLLLATGEGGFSVDWAILPALLGAICWAALSALRTRVPTGPPGVVLHFAFACTLVTWPAALLLEGSTLPPRMELVRLAAVGILPVGLANHLWDIATRHGNPVLLASLSFAEPIMSTALIAWILWQPVTWREGAALLLVLLAVLASVVSQRRRSPAAAP